MAIRIGTFKAPDARELVEEVRIECEQPTDDGGGGDAVEWIFIGLERARIQPIIGDDAVAGGGRQLTALWDITIRWRGDLTATHRLVWNEKNMLIRTPAADPDGRQRWLHFICETGVPT